MEHSFDLPGKVRNTRLPATHWLKPLFEAVSNSIQAIQDAKEVNGKITISIIRNQPPSLFVPAGTLPPISSFAVTDNGIGFTEENCQSFFKAESRYKEARGCKGVGRFLWLKAFGHAEIDSVFKEAGELMHRHFRFVRSESGVESEVCEPADPTAAPGTAIKLVGLLPRFRDQSPKTAEIIAERIVDFCLPQFANDQAPSITLTDTDGSTHDLNAIFKEMDYYRKLEVFEAGGHKFKITHLLVPASKEQTHRLYLCANGWSVRPESLAERMPELRSQPTPIRDLANQGRQLFYTGFVTGDLLDEWVSDERIDFAWDDVPNLFGSEDGVTKASFMDAAVERINSYLEPHLTEIRAQRDKEIQEHVFDRSPQYRPLLKRRPELLKDIPPNLAPDKLELKLYEANQKYNVELHEEYHRLLEVKDPTAVELEEHNRRVEQFLEEWNEEGMAKLAWHVAHRQSTLAFLEQELELDEEGNYRLEDAIHRVIFPLRTTSDDIQWDRQNLWVIDEKLSYHFYLASDKQMNKVAAKPVKSQKRLDLIIFNRPIAVVDSKAFNSIVIFEFKRAMRDDYTDANNPILQVINYVRRLKTGGEKDANGRPITPHDGTAYYGYIICDPTDKLTELATTYQLKPTPDGKGFFGYHSVGVYLEVIYFSKLLADARLRNQVLFDHLGCKVFPKPSKKPQEPVAALPVAVKAKTPRTATGVQAVRTPSAETVPGDPVPTNKPK